MALAVVIPGWLTMLYTRYYTVTINQDSGCKLRPEGVLTVLLSRQIGVNMGIGQCHYIVLSH